MNASQIKVAIWLISLLTVATCLWKVSDASGRDRTDTLQARAIEITNQHGIVVARIGSSETGSGECVISDERGTPLLTLGIDASGVSRITLADRTGNPGLTLKPSDQPKPLARGGKDGWKSKSNWRALRHGQSMDDVRQLLGEPGQVMRTGSITTWMYPDILGGNVKFGGESVDGWTEP